MDSPVPRTTACLTWVVHEIPEIADELQERIRWKGIASAGTDGVATAPSQQNMKL
jgi:hypothetical protein